jgi:hypothetical protein
LPALAILLVAASACGSEQQPKRSEASSVAPSSTSSQSAAEFCGDLNAFSAAAGPAFEMTASGLMNKDRKPSRKALSSAVLLMQQSGSQLVTKVPDHVRDDLTIVVNAAAEAAKKLASGAPPDKAVAGLMSDKVSAARKTVTDYRGPC